MAAAVVEINFRRDSFAGRSIKSSVLPFMLVTMGCRAYRTPRRRSHAKAGFLIKISRAEGGLESKIASNLNKARAVLPSDLAEVSVGEIGIHGVEVGSIEDIEELKAELKINPLGDGRIF